MKYTAFISYNSKDDQWAKWLQRKLERYSLPVKLEEEQTKRLRVFRYRADLNTVSLNEGLARELDESRWLIVICSPRSARSIWCGKEIQHFIDTGRRDRIIPFIIEGTPYSSGEQECLNPVLKAAFPDDDLLGVNINDYGDDLHIYRKRKALVRVVSLLIELPDAYAQLWNRYRLRFWESVAIKVAGIVAVIAMLLFATLRNEPFDTQVSLFDQSADNEQLPRPDSLNLLLVLDQEERSLTLHATDERGSYQNLPGKYAGQLVRMRFTAYGYASVDTMVTLERNGEVIVGIHRDDTYGLLAGSIIDENGQPIAEAVIEAEGAEARSDGEGHFELHIAPERQKPQPHVRISKPGYRTEEYFDQQIGSHWRVMLIKE